VIILTAANVNDCQMLEQLLDGIPSLKNHHGKPTHRPQKLHGDRGYDYAKCRFACRARGIKHRIARLGMESKTHLGRHRWVVERTFAWLHRFRRLLVRFERRADIHLAFLFLACALIAFQFC
jgi:transposase